jgi:hypothetical protein
MKIGFKSDIAGLGEVRFDPAVYQTTLTEISGKEVWIRLLKSPASEKLFSGLSLAVDLPGERVAVTVREAVTEGEWIVLRCRAKKIFPAIVIGRHSLDAVPK